MSKDGMSKDGMSKDGMSKDRIEYLECIEKRMSTKRQKIVRQDMPPGRYIRIRHKRIFSFRG